MMMEDPAYIQSLLDPTTNHSCYFSIGDPHEGQVERIGVVPPMLMAHSLVLRRALDIQKSELKEKWDIPVTDITPKMFRNVLRYAYGFNNIKNHSLPHSVDLLALADRWVMKPMTQDLANHIASIITPVNVCLAMRDPVCLRVTKVEEEICRLVKKNSMRVLTSPYLHLVCPAGMRYIVLLKSLQASEVDVWRAVMRWARERVLEKDVLFYPYQMDAYIHSKLVVPCQKYIKLCSLNMIDLVEEVLANHPDKHKNITGIDKCHFIPAKPPRSLYICTESKNENHLKHEEFELKIVHSCGSWMDAIYVLSSTLMVTNSSDDLLELYSIVCTSKKRLNHDLVEDHNLVDPVNHKQQVATDFNCAISCFVKVTAILNDEHANETEVSFQHFETDVSYGHDFQIILRTNNDKLQLDPKSSYKIETKFSTPHPMWYVSEIDYAVPGQSSGLELACGLVNKENNWYGSHIKYVLYRKLQEDTLKKD